METDFEECLGVDFQAQRNSKFENFELIVPAGMCIAK